MPTAEQTIENAALRRRQGAPLWLARYRVGEFKLWGCRNIGRGRV
jgi:hypothetical protein